MVLIKVHTLIIPMGSHGLHCKPWDPIGIIKVHGLHCKPWDPIGIVKVGTLINTICCKPDDGRIRPKNVAS